MLQPCKLCARLVVVRIALFAVCSGSPTDYSVKFHTHCVAMGSLTCGQTHTDEGAHIMTHQSEKSERPVNDCRGQKGEQDCGGVKAL